MSAAELEFWNGAKTTAQRLPSVAWMNAKQCRKAFTFNPDLQLRTALNERLRQIRIEENRQLLKRQSMANLMALHPSERLGCIMGLLLSVGSELPEFEDATVAVSLAVADLGKKVSSAQPSTPNPKQSTKR